MSSWMDVRSSAGMVFPLLYEVGPVLSHRWFTQATTSEGRQRRPCISKGTGAGKSGWRLMSSPMDRKPRKTARSSSVHRRSWEGPAGRSWVVVFRIPFRVPVWPFGALPATIHTARKGTELGLYRPVSTDCGSTNLRE